MFKRINRLRDIEFFNLISDNEKIIILLQALDIIPDEKNCIKCNKPMKIKQNNDYNIGYMWKCSKCKVKRNLLEDSSLKGFKVSPTVFLQFAFYFYNKNNFTANYVMENCKIGREMYSHLLSFFRSKISNYV
ncbi:hypothetical protein DMUE_3496, partial [Dictyocoela muelleri]